MTNAIIKTKKKSCCCTGHRPKGFPYLYEKDIKKHKAYLKALEEKIKFVITVYGLTNFISGMAMGVDLDFAEIVLNLRDEQRFSVTLECAIPCPNQTLKWSAKEKVRYNAILEHADNMSTVSDVYSPDCMLKRNRYMVDKSDIVIAVFNGIQSGRTWYTVNYAKKNKKQVELIALNKIN